MNEKKAKKLRRSIMTHDEWLSEKRNRKYVFTEFNEPPRIGNKVIFVTSDNTVLFGEVIRRHQDLTYDIKAGTDEVYGVGLGAIKPRRAACTLDRVSQYKEAKKHVKA